MMDALEDIVGFPKVENGGGRPIEIAGLLHE
jgi:hypothetical protein